MIVAGTDAQEGQMNFGDDFYYELEIYSEAGLTNTEVLRTATGNAAKAFNLPVGILKIGSKANMVLVTGNPLLDLDNLKRIEHVWRNGAKYYAHGKRIHKHSLFLHDVLNDYIELLWTISMRKFSSKTAEIRIGAAQKIYSMNCASFCTSRDLD